MHAELDRGVPVMPGAAELVAALSADAVPVAMATNAARGFAEKALACAGHPRTFDVLLTADDVPLPKPAPDIYVAAAQALGVEPELCVAIEDSPTGVRSALDAGMTVIGVLSHPGVELDAHHVVPTLNDPLLWDLLGVEAARDRLTSAAGFPTRNLDSCPSRRTGVVLPLAGISEVFEAIGDFFSQHRQRRAWFRC